MKKSTHRSFQCLSCEADRSIESCRRGLPVTVDGQIVGGIGLSSGTATEDQVVAEAAVAYFYEKTGFKA